MKPDGFDQLSRLPAGGGTPRTGLEDLGTGASRLRAHRRRRSRYATMTIGIGPWWFSGHRRRHRRRRRSARAIQAKSLKRSNSLLYNILLQVMDPRDAPPTTNGPQERATSATSILIMSSKRRQAGGDGRRARSVFGRPRSHRSQILGKDGQKKGDSKRVFHPRVPQPARRPRCFFDGPSRSR